MRQINVPLTKTEKVGGTSTSGAALQLLHYAVCLFAYFFGGSLIPLSFCFFNMTVKNTALSAF